LKATANEAKDKAADKLQDLKEGAAQVKD